MKRIYSLKGRNLFREIYQKGTKLQDKGIRIFILKYDKKESGKPDLDNKISANKKTIKIGISLNRKFGKANIRNRAKRQIRAICSGLLDNMQDGFCIIIKLEKNVKNINFKEERKIIESLLKRAGVIEQ